MPGRKVLIALGRFIGVAILLIAVGLCVQLRERGPM